MSRTTLITLIAALALGALGAPELAAAKSPPAREPLTRIYRGDDGGFLYLRQLGAKVYGFGEHPGRDYAYVLTGTITGDRIATTWWDVAKQSRAQSGAVELQVSQNGGRLVLESAALGPRVLTSIAAEGIPWPKREAAGFQATTFRDLDGLWLGDDASRFYVREQSGTIAAVVERDSQPGERPGYVSVLVGSRKFTSFRGTWVDVPKGLESRSGTFIGLLGFPERAVSFRFQGQTGSTRAESLVPEYTLDWDAFAKEITETLNGKVVGYAYAITRHGAIVRSGAGGRRRLEIDGGALPFTTKTQAQTADAAKTITATAIVKALASRGEDVDSRVKPYLPSCWKRGKDVSTLTFKQLLTHRSRLPKVSCNGGDGYLCLLKMIEKGRTQPKTRVYNTDAFDLLRLLTPMVLDRTATSRVFERAGCRNTNGLLNRTISRRFARYVVDDVLAPAGASASFSPSGKLAMSVLDHVRFLSALDRGLVISEQLVARMKDELLGFDAVYDGIAGDYVWSNGVCPDFGGKTRGCETVAMTFPGDIQLYIATNSGRNGYAGTLQNLAGRAFDEGLERAFD